MSCLILLLCASVSLGAAPLGAPTPPPAPDVPPVISGSYAADLNGNCIDDSLEAGAGELSIASSEPVEVELIFSEPITQRQIDGFLRLGGQITYIYEVVSYGWNGYISQRNINLLPSAMGPALVQVQAVQQVQYYMDTATQVARVRPIWKAGFAGLPNGIDGDPGTTIGFLGGGVDETHADLQGRNVYWVDFTADNEPTPVDYDGHDTLVAGVATGTGVSGGADAGELFFTFTYANASSPAWGHETNPFALPAGRVTLKSSAWWTGRTSILDHWRWKRGTNGATTLAQVGTYLRSSSPAVLTNTFTASGSDIYSVALIDYDTKQPVENVTIVTSVSPYPGVGDGLNRFSGVAPGCKWAAVKIFGRNRSGASSSNMTKGLDEFAKKCTEKNIKIVNISVGYHILGIPGMDTGIRDKVNTLVNNGVIVVVAAGNGANDGFELFRTMADPARAAMAITVGASNDENALTEYSTYGFIMPRTNVGEDFKPDVIAPGGSYIYTGMMSADSGSSDGIGIDKQANDYASGVGTSYAAPFVSGCAALIIDAMQQQGIPWQFGSNAQPLYVKMLLCATASETNAQRDNKQFNPTLSRANAGPEGFPVGKDQHEGYGLINADAAVEAVLLTYAPGSTETIMLGGDAAAKRVWARKVNLKAGCDIDVVLSNPAGADADLYLYSGTPSNTGTPVILASSTDPNAGREESLHYLPTADATALLVVKRISGAGTFSLHSVQAGPPTAEDIVKAGGIDTPLTITLKAGDDGKPNPPGAISYTIASLPKYGKLQSHSTGAAITTVPAKLPGFDDKVTYVPNAGWLGEDSFTYYADDGGTAPFGGRSNTATVKITIVREITVEYQVAAGVDDASGIKGMSYQRTDDTALAIGNYNIGMRFRNVNIPKGAQIKSATLKICSYTSLLRYSVECSIKAEAADNPADFSGSTRTLSGLSTTGASKTWSLATSPAWTPNTWYDSPDISAVVQEIVNRSGWSAGNALTIIFAGSSLDGGERRFWSYDGDSAKAARLIVTYQPR